MKADTFIRRTISRGHVFTMSPPLESDVERPSIGLHGYQISEYLKQATYKLSGVHNKSPGRCENDPRSVVKSNSPNKGQTRDKKSNKRAAKERILQRVTRLFIFLEDEGEPCASRGAWVSKRRQAGCCGKPKQNKTRKAEYRNAGA